MKEEYSTSIKARRKIFRITGRRLGPIVPNGTDGILFLNPEMEAVIFPSEGERFLRCIRITVIQGFPTLMGSE